MAARIPIAPSAPSAPPPGAAAEHIYIGSEDLSADPKSAARTPREGLLLRNPLRRTGAELTLFDEGYLKVALYANGNSDPPFFLDLRFLDPAPKIERVIAVRWLATALGCASLAALAAFLLRFDALSAVAVWALAGAGLATGVASYAGIHGSYEQIELCTRHGRAAVLRVVANVGSINKLRAFVPRLCRSIEEAAERTGAEPAAYLRAEMREHYRLRRDGVLDNDACARGTGNILAQFDVHL